MRLSADLDQIICVPFSPANQPAETKFESGPRSLSSSINPERLFGNHQKITNNRLEERQSFIDWLISGSRNSEVTEKQFQDSNSLGEYLGEICAGLGRDEQTADARLAACEQQLMRPTNRRLVTRAWPAAQRLRHKARLTKDQIRLLLGPLMDWPSIRYSVVEEPSEERKVPVLLLKVAKLSGQRRVEPESGVAKSPDQTLRWQRSELLNSFNYGNESFRHAQQVEQRANEQANIQLEEPARSIDSNNEVMECRRRTFTFEASKSDSEGNRCTGTIKANICYGGCDTGEIADWIFPHKKSIHKVCGYGKRVRRLSLLTDCNSPEVDQSLREYHFIDAASCVCQRCNSADTTCVGSMSQPYLAP